MIKFIPGSAMGSLDMADRFNRYRCLAEDSSQGTSYFQKKMLLSENHLPSPSIPPDKSD